MAAIERGEGRDEAAVRGWLAKAVSAARGPHWTCDNCGAVHEAWSPTCRQCDAFDSLEWKLTDGPSDSSANAAMAPLLAGSDEISASAEADAVEEPAKT